MSNYLKTSFTKLMTLALAFTVAAGFMFVINTERSFAKGEPVEKVGLTIDVPKCGTEITTESSYSVEPDTNLVVAERDKYYEYYSFWCTKEGDYYSGTAKGDTPLYVKMWIGVESHNGYYWPTDDDGNYTGSIEVNGKPADIVSCQMIDVGYGLGLIVKVTPEHDWDGDTCKGCGAKKSEPTPTPSASAPLFATMSSKGAKAMNFSWNKVAGAAGYEVYLSKCNTGGNKYTPKKVKTVKGNKTAKCTVKGLKKGIPYKGYVRAYKMVNGKKTYIGKSLTVHAFTNGGSKKYTNPKSVSVKKSKVSLKAGKTYSIKASVKKLKARKALINTSHAPKLRYVSSNPKVATVSGKGKITAKAKGKCNVYAIAINGARKAVTVTVK